MIPLNDFKRQWKEIGPELHLALERVGLSGYYILGSEVSQFEERLARFCGTKFAVGVGNGTDAIEIALRASGISPGDRVLTSPLSAFATTLAISRAGGVPVYVDTTIAGALNPEQAIHTLKKSSIRFVVPVHLFGLPGSLEWLDETLSQGLVSLVEDCAQSIGSSLEDKPTGLKGIAGTFSFYPTKNLGAMGDAGAIISSDQDFSARCRRLRDYGQSAKYLHDEVGLNSRLDEVHAAFLSVLIEKLPHWNARRAEIAKRMLAEIQNPELSFLPSPHGAQSNYHLFPLFVRDAKRRESLQKHLSVRGIGSNVHYPLLIPHQKAIAQIPHEIRFPLEISLTLTCREITVPCHPFLTDDEVDQIISTLNQWNPA